MSHLFKNVAFIKVDFDLHQENNNKNINKKKNDAKLKFKFRKVSNITLNDSMMSYFDICL